MGEGDHPQGGGGGGRRAYGVGSSAASTSTPIIQPAATPDAAIILNGDHTGLVAGDFVL